MGEVNMGALSEFEQLNERYQFLKGQQEDLVQSIQTLMTRSIGSIEPPAGASRPPSIPSTKRSRKSSAVCLGEDAHR